MRELFAPPCDDVKLEDCDFYHTVEVPGYGVIRGFWDLRGRVDEYLGNYDFGGKRVLEIGPASGFLTFEMERRGAEVVALEVPDDPGWDFVPFPNEVIQPILMPRRRHMRRIKNSFWFLHRIYNSRAQLCYGDSCNIPNEIGKFDVAIMASVLLHCERPVRVIAECSKLADTLIVCDTYNPMLEGNPACLLVPDANNQIYDTWWKFSTTYFEQYFGVIGFHYTFTTQHDQLGFSQNEETDKQTVPLFTIVASKNELSSIIRQRDEAH